MRGEGEGARQAGDVDVQLLLQLADQRGLRRSPGLTLPPGNSQRPASGLPSGRRASSTRPSASTRRDGGDQQQGAPAAARPPWRAARRPPRAAGTPGDVLPPALKEQHRHRPAAREEGLHPPPPPAAARAARRTAAGTAGCPSARWHGCRRCRDWRAPSGRAARPPPAPRHGPRSGGRPSSRARRCGGRAIQGQADAADQSARRPDRPRR